VYYVVASHLDDEDVFVVRRFGGVPIGSGFRVPTFAYYRPLRPAYEYVTAHVSVGTANAIVKDGSGTKGTVWFWRGAA